MRAEWLVAIVLCDCLFSFTAKTDELNSNARPYRLNFDILVKAKISKESCAPNITSDIVLRNDELELCAPDPAAKVCANITDADTKKIVDQKKRYHELMIAGMSSLLEDASNGVDPEIKKQVKANVIYSMLGAFERNEKWFSREKYLRGKPELVSAINSSFQNPDVLKVSSSVYIQTRENAAKLPKLLGKEKVSAVVEKHAQTFIETLKKSMILYPDEVEILSEVISSCSKRIWLSSMSHPEKYLLFYGQKDPAKGLKNAFARTIVPVSRFEENEFGKNGRKLNLILDDLPYCGINLSPGFWMDCLEDNVVCAETIFHELAHFIDSCNILWKARVAEFEMKNAEAGYGNPDTKDSRGIIFKKQKDAAKTLAATIIDSSACLTTLSAPHHPIKNSCPVLFGKDIDDTELRNSLIDRCGMRQSKYFPSQWREAEADFWSASAFAGYLEKHFPTITAREDALKTYLRTYCAENAEYNSRGLWIDDFSKSNLSKGNKQKPNFEFDPVPAHYKVKAVNSFLYGKRKQVSFSEIDGEHCSIRPGSRKWTYSLDVKAESVTTWEDHQPWADRFNRNILRNSEIRSALRCKLSKDVPVSCSPLGTSSSVLVQ